MPDLPIAIEKIQTGWGCTLLIHFPGTWQQEAVKVSVYESAGSLVASFVIQPGSNTIDLPNVQCDLLFVKLETASDTVYKKVSIAT